MASNDKLVREWCDNFAPLLRRIYPRRVVDVVTAPDGYPSVQADGDYFRISDDGESILATRYQGDGTCIVVRLDMTWRQTGVWVVHLGDPAAN